MCSPAEFDPIIGIGFEFGDCDEVPISEVSQAGQIKGSKSEAQFAAADEVGGHLEPAGFGELIGGDVGFSEVGQVWN